MGSSQQGWTFNGSTAVSEKGSQIIPMRPLSRKSKRKAYMIQSPDNQIIKATAPNGAVAIRRFYDAIL